MLSIVSHASRQRVGSWIIDVGEWMDATTSAQILQRMTQPRHAAPVLVQRINPAPASPGLSPMTRKTSTASERSAAVKVASEEVDKHDTHISKQQNNLLFGEFQNSNADKFCTVMGNGCHTYVKKFTENEGTIGQNIQSKWICCCDTDL